MTYLASTDSMVGALCGINGISLHHWGGHTESCVWELMCVSVDPLMDAVGSPFARLTGSCTVGDGRVGREDILLHVSVVSTIFVPFCTLSALYHSFTMM